MRILSQLSRFFSGKPHSRIFVSHANEDNIDHVRYVPALQRSCISVDLDIKFPKGELWHYQIFEALMEADAIVCFLTPNAVHSEWVLEEIGFGGSLGYLYLICHEGDFKRFCKEAVDEDKGDRFMPVIKSILNHEIDLIPNNIPLEEYLADAQTIKNLRRFLTCRDPVQKEYRKKILASLHFSSEPGDKLILGLTNLGNLITARIASRGGSESEERKLNYRLGKLNKIIDELKNWKMPSVFVTERSEEELVAQINEEISRSSELIHTASSKGKRTDQSWDENVILLAIIILKRHQLVHYLIRRGSFGNAFNLLGLNSEEIHRFCNICIGFIDDLSESPM